MLAKRLMCVFTVMMLAACEQVMVFGPVVDADVTVSELRSGNVIVSNVVSSDMDDLEANNPEEFLNYVDIQKLLLTGLVVLKDEAEFDPDTWYVVTASNGFDLDANDTQLLDQGSVQVAGSITVLMTGAQLERGITVIGPAQEAAWQWVRPFIEYLDDAELTAALDEYAVAVVDDLASHDGEHGYEDLLTFNSLGHNDLFRGSLSTLDELKSALAAGDNDNNKRIVAANLVNLSGPVGADEAMFEHRISPDIAQRRCVACHVEGGQAANTAHFLERTSNNNHLEANLRMYARLVGSLGVSGILSKTRGIGHGGGTQLSEGSQDYEDFETFLNLL